jgi:hypothetical protein
LHVAALSAYVLPPDHDDDISEPLLSALSSPAGPDARFPSKEVANWSINLMEPDVPKNFGSLTHELRLAQGT